MRKNINYRFLVIAALLALTSFSQSAMGKPFVDKIPADVQLKSDLEYVPGGGASQSLDLYLPKSDAPLVPLVVFIHGGGWNSGRTKTGTLRFTICSSTGSLLPPSTIA